MKKILLLFLLPVFSFTAKEKKTMRLTGYFIVQCFKPASKCPCGLDIASTELISADSIKNATCLCDGNYYRNFGLVKYVNPKDLDLGRIDDFDYQVKLQDKEHLVFLSTNKNILRDAFSKDSTLIKDNALVKQVESDTVTAEMIAKLIDGAQLVFKRKIAYDVLLKGEMTVVRMKDCGKHDAQYLFLNDPQNGLEFIKVIKDPF